MIRRLSLFAVFVSFLTGCAGRQPAPRYVRAEPVKDDPPKPTVVQVPHPIPVPGQLKPAPATNRRRASSPKHPSDIIREANRKATEGPSADDYYNAIMTYDYTPGTLYQVYTAPQKLTDVQLQSGEHIVGKPATGDNIRWVLARGSSAVGPNEQQHIYIKPTRPDLDTTLCINTDRRSYILELHSYDEAWMAAVAWRYPQDEVAQLESTLDQQQMLAQSSTPTGVSIDKLNFGYGIAVLSGRPQWVPVQVFDDTHKTYIRFPAAMLDREAPALFVVSSSGDTQLVNYRVKNDTYIVDRLFEDAELRLGQQTQEIVRIVRTR
ncbi:MAG TPA: P-type conjugative transfer protein TrbG [Acidothermaceae bacterium]